MIKDELIKDIDVNLYYETCKLAQKYAANISKQLDYNECFESDMPHNISSKLWNLDLPITELIDICFQLYEEMPCYAYLMHLKMNFWKFSDEEKRIVIEKFYEYLNNDNLILSKPVQYSLWCDYFEDDKFSKLVWQALLNRWDGNENFIKKLLALSGPIDFSLKELLYKKIIHNKRLHYDIYQSIRFGIFEFCGKIDMNKAKEILEVLEIDRTSDEYKILTAHL